MSGCTACRSVPHTVCFGETRKVSWQSTSASAARSTRSRIELVDQRVWARVDGDELIVVARRRDRRATRGRPAHADDTGPAEHQG